MSLSKIIRHVKVAPRVHIGDRQFDVAEENRAETDLASFCPAVAVQTDADGAKLIPILEVFKIHQTLKEESEKAHQRGVQDGHRAGLQEGLAEAQKVLQNLEKAISDTVGQREAILNEARQKVLELVLQISRKVTFDAFSADPEITLELISGVIDQLVDRSRLNIKVNPHHLPVVEQHIDRFLKGEAMIKDLSIVPDPRVTSGGCFIETPSGDIDARLDSQFKVIEETMLSAEDEN